MATWGVDSFTRADSSTSLGTADTGGAWTAHTGTWGIATNKGYCATPVVDAHSYASLGVAQGDITLSADVTLSATANRAAAGLLLRYIDANNRWMVWLYKSTGLPDYVYLEQLVGGVGTGGQVLTPAGLINGTTYNLKAIIVGQTAEVYVNGVRKIASVSLNLSGPSRYGLSLHKGSVDYDDGGSRFDNFLVTTPDRVSRMGRVLSS